MMNPALNRYLQLLKEHVSQPEFMVNDPRFVQPFIPKSTSTMPELHTKPTDSRAIQTLRGMYEWKNRNGFYSMQIYFFSDPEKDNEEFVERAKEGLSHKKFKQEYLIDFSSVSGEPVYPEYDTDWHFRDVEYNPKLPLVVCSDVGVWSCFLFCQYTKYGQLRVVGLDMNMSEMKSEPHCQRAVQYMNTNFPEPSELILVADIACKKKESMVEYTWEDLLSDYFGMRPYSHGMNKNKDRCIDLLGKMFLETVINPDTGKQEPRIIISNKLNLVDITLKGGYRYKEQKDLASPKTVNIEEIHPFEDVANSLEYTAYHLFFTETREKKSDSRHKFKHSLKALYNR